MATICFIIAMVILSSCNSTEVNEKSAPAPPNPKEIARSLNSQAIKLWEQGQLDSAIILLDSAQSIDNNASVHLNKAGIYVDQKDYLAAIEEYNQGLKVLPIFGETFLKLGMLYDITNQHLQAEEQYLQALKIFEERIKVSKGKSLKSRIHRVETLLFLGRVEEGQAEIKEMLKEQPDNSRLLQLLNFDKEEYLNDLFNQ